MVSNTEGVEKIVGDPEAENKGHGVDRVEEVGCRVALIELVSYIVPDTVTEIAGVTLL